MTKPQLITDYDALLMIGRSALNYRLSDEAFLVYANSRGVLYKAGCGRRFDYYTMHDINPALFNKLFSHAAPYNGVQYQYTRQELALHYEISLATRGALQNCWDVYQATL